MRTKGGRQDGKRWALVSNRGDQPRYFFIYCWCRPSFNVFPFPPSKAKFKRDLCTNKHKAATRYMLFLSLIPRSAFWRTKSLCDKMRFAENKKKKLKIETVNFFGRRRKTFLLNIPLSLYLHLLSTIFSPLFISISLSIFISHAISIFLTISISFRTLAS